ncbi:MAG: DUF5615 family PIN-like protein [Candidatus Omnitrophica bacterium]|nr:DUF5615 family PIN-like protein [Candidatus Omnitrophota bacterium]MBU1366317.1 DUF5615 family PIN-like protein [Candidatus Omnitrophota bacterium]MBU1524044.1 DUF5615 family PIN-like protein [Candidatus Omnitrophota bacterium]MBU2437428.1 DUF5615 family PIN-like protein [Candidatus Omnitrophota bacterium]
MEFILDECVLGKTKKLLKDLGLSINTVVELGKASICDDEVLELAKNRKAILVSCDLHFSNLLLYPLGSHWGIIVLRMRASDTPNSINQIHKVFTSFLKDITLSTIKGHLVIIDRNKYRIHKSFSK